MTQDIFSNGIVRLYHISITEHRKYAGSYIDSTAIPLIQLVYNQIAKGSNLSAVVNKHAGFQLAAALFSGNR